MNATEKKIRGRGLRSATGPLKQNGQSEWALILEKVTFEQRLGGGCLQKHTRAKGRMCPGLLEEPEAASMAGAGGAGPQTKVRGARTGRSQMACRYYKGIGFY